LLIENTYFFSSPNSWHRQDVIITICIFIAMFCIGFILGVVYGMLVATNQT